MAQDTPQAAEARQILAKSFAILDAKTAVNNIAAALSARDAQLAECYRLSGADPDGNEDWRLAPYAVQEVRRLRAESDESDAQLTTLAEELHAAINEPMYAGTRQDWIHRAQAAEAKVTALAQQVERLEAALNDIAAWHDGPEVTGRFDEPGAARVARAALRREEG